MWDEEINKKIKDAADQYHPAYDDGAWSKMEVLLDEHLPRKKERRRIIYFLPLALLLVAGGAFFTISRNETTRSLKISEKTLLKGNPDKSKSEQVKSAAPDKVATNPVALKPGKNLIADVKKENKFLKEPTINNANPYTKKPNGLSYSNTDIIYRNSQPASKNVSAGPKKQIENSPSTEINDKNNIGIKNSISETIVQSEKPSNEGFASPSVAGNNTPLQKASTVPAKDEKETVKSEEIVKTGNQKDANTNVKQTKIKKNFLQNFGIGLSIGPDISAVKLSEAGKITPTYGAQISYSFNDRFTLRTGFYVARKIYSVSEDEYHLPQGPPGSSAYLESVNGNCKIYEIPLTLSYNFGKVKNHHWFASAGLSSYFMKKESYVYFYKYPSGTTNNWSWSVSNQNKHYFSIMDMSAAYEYSINKRFSITAEPYIKLPLSGIGAGKIKLNSAGILFTVAVKPF